jgi:hypothetical protein
MSLDAPERGRDRCDFLRCITCAGSGLVRTLRRDALASEAQAGLEAGPNAPPHILRWAVYPEWGWTSGDAQEALTTLKRFGSVTALNGHLHQVLQKLECAVTFHTPMSTAFPRPAPGQGPGPGPLKVPAEEAGALLRLPSVTSTAGTEALAIVDSTLG